MHISANVAKVVCRSKVYLYYAEIKNRNVTAMSGWGNESLAQAFRWNKF